MPELRYNYMRFKLSIRVMFKNFLLIYSTGESKVILPVKQSSNLFIIFYSKKEKKKSLVNPWKILLEVMPKNNCYRAML